MKSKKIWMANVIKAADSCNTRMPWERGAMRKAMIARRKAAEGETKARATA